LRRPAGRYACPVPSPKPRVVAPISAWIAAIGLAALALAAAWYAVTSVGVQPEAPFTHFNRARIESFAVRASQAGAKRVVLLGSSALKYATRDERDFAVGVARDAGVPVQTLRVTSNWGTFYDFAPLADDLLRAQPDLVVMESDFFAADRPPTRRFLIWIRDLRSRLGLAVEGDEPVSEADVQFTYPCWKRKASMRHAMLREERAGWLTVRPGGPGPDAARAFAARLLDAGAMVALVSVPRRPDYESESRMTRDAISDDVGWRALEGRVRHWEPQPLPTGLYCDLTHVTPAGQASISDWLESVVARELADSAG
jgi:hypothetical protein